MQRVHLHATVFILVLIGIITRYIVVKLISDKLVIAACLCIVIALALLPHYGVIGDLPGGSAAGGGGKDSDLYAYYAGPVLPLAAAEGGEGLTAERRVNYDFSPFDPNWERDKENHLRFREYCIVTDGYLLTAPDGEERTVTRSTPSLPLFMSQRRCSPASR